MHSRITLVLFQNRFDIPMLDWPGYNRGTSMSSPASQQQRRRGTRVRAQIPVRVTSLDPTTDFSESCHTLMVNPQGCGIRCSRPLETGVQIRMDDLPGRGTALATVACTRPLSEGSKYWIVGVALQSPGNLWCIAPAPPDWGTYSAAPRFLPSSVKYQGEAVVPDPTIYAQKA
jgi:hypothetical protein